MDDGRRTSASTQTGQALVGDYHDYALVVTGRSHLIAIQPDELWELQRMQFKFTQ
jgi:hypothetical protein